MANQKDISVKQHVILKPSIGQVRILLRRAIRKGTFGAEDNENNIFCDMLTKLLLLDAKEVKDYDNTGTELSKHADDTKSSVLMAREGLLIKVIIDHSAILRR